MFAPIATVADAAGFGYDVTDADLARASTRIRTYTRQQVTAGTSTVLLAGPGPWLLPQRPVVAITTVVDDDGTPVDCQLRGQMLHADGCDLTVTWTHGFDLVPDGLLELCAQIAHRLASTPAALESGVQQESAGGVTRGYGSWSAGAVAELMPSEKTVIDRFYPRRPRTIQLTP